MQVFHSTLRLNDKYISRLSVSLLLLWVNCRPAWPRLAARDSWGWVQSITRSEQNLRLVFYKDLWFNQEKNLWSVYILSCSCIAFLFDLSCFPISRKYPTWIGCRLYSSNFDGHKNNVWTLEFSGISLLIMILFRSDWKLLNRFTEWSTRATAETMPASPTVVSNWIFQC